MIAYMLALVKKKIFEGGEEISLAEFTILLVSFKQEA